AFAGYVRVVEADVLAGWVEEARAAGLVAVGLETDGRPPLRATLLGVSLAVAPGRACYVPMRHQAAPVVVAKPVAEPKRRGKAAALAVADPLVAEAEAAGADGVAAEDAAADVVSAAVDGGLAAGGDDVAVADGVAVPDGATAGDAAVASDGAAPIEAGQLGAAEVFAALGGLLADPCVLKVMHNAKAGLLLLAREGVTEVVSVDDVALMSYAQDAGRHGHGVEELARLHLGHTTVALDAVTGTGRARLPLAQSPADKVAAYAGEAADAVLRLWHALRPALRVHKALALYEQVERRMVPVLARMEEAGIRVDGDELRRMSVDFGERMAALEGQVHALAGRPFALGSPKQLGEILFDEMKLPGGKRTATGAWSTDVVALQTLAEQGLELPTRLLEWRQIAKLKSTYADALVAEMDAGTGRVHTSFAMTVTSTGRLSSNDPNLQNIPIRTEEGGRIRRAFVAADGHVLVSADYSQIELRLLAHVADIPALRDAFATGQDIHARTASEVFGVPMEQMDAATRRRAKAINFGIIYGISAFGLGRQLGIDPAEARVYIAAYFERYPGIRDYMERTKEEARRLGYVVTPFGRRCWVQGIADRNMQRRSGAERQAINAPLQGGAADVIKRAMVRLPAAMAEVGLRSRMLLQVHDELLFESPEDEAGEMAAVAKRVMEAAVVLSVPLVVETGQGRSWAEAH
ncbi:MAG: DNA polymerase I, partial [Janthinobacterium lividum]